MKNNKFCKFSALVLAAAMVLAMIPVSALAGFSGWFSGWADAEEVSVETQATNGTVTQPFASGTQGSTNFRIPAIVTLNDGTIVAAADARWNATTDGGGIDTLVAYSKDNGESWNYSWGAYLGDNNKQYSSSSATFIDPALATDGETVYLLVDLYPAGYSNLGYSSNSAFELQSTGSGFDENGRLRISAGKGDIATKNENSYTFYLGTFEDGYASIYNTDGSAVKDYKVDEKFNLYKNDDLVSNLFYKDAAYQAYPQQYLYLTKSVDGGETWSAPTLLNMKNDVEVFYGVGPGGGYVTSTGRIIFPCYDTAEIFGSMQASVIYSDDGGETWTRSAGIGTDGYTSESTVSEVKLGETNYLYLFTRSNKTGSSSVREYYVSSDNGETWEKKGDFPSDITYGEKSALGSITYSKLIDDCPAIIFSAPASTSYNSGVIYVGLVQSDGTINFKYKKTVTSDDNYFKYSDLAELGDGRVALLYESNGSNGKLAEITFEVFDIADLCGGATITNPTVTDETFGISVSAPGLTSVAVIAKDIDTTLYPDGVTDVKAYDITPYQGTTAYTGEATVTFNRPDGWEDKTRIKGFIKDSSTGKYDWDLTATVSNNTVAVTFPHFSQVGIYYAAETDTGDGNVTDEPENTVEVTLTVGEKQTKTVNGTYSVGTDDGGIVSCTTTNRTESGETTYTLVTDTTLPDGEYYVSTSQSDTNPTAHLNVVTENESRYLKNDSGEYFYPTKEQYNHNKSIISKGQTAVEIEKSGNGYTTTTTTTTFFGTTYYHSLSVSDGEFTASNSSNANGKTVLYFYTAQTTEAGTFTDITFTGITPGTTYVTVGETTYKIIVSKGEHTVYVQPDSSVTLDTKYGTEIKVNPKDSSIATASVNSGVITIKGLAEGTTTMETELYKITIVVATEPALDPNKTLVSSEDVSALWDSSVRYAVAAGDPVSGLMLSYYADSTGTVISQTSFKLKAETGKILRVEVDNKNAAVELSEEGIITITANGVGKSTVTVYYTDNTKAEIPVRVIQGNTKKDVDEVKQRLFAVYVDALYNSELYAAVASGKAKDTTWMQIPEHYVIYAELDSEETISGITFATKAAEGYATTYIASSASNKKTLLGSASFHYIGRIEKETGTTYGSGSDENSAVYYFYDYATSTHLAEGTYKSDKTIYSKDEFNTLLQLAVSKELELDAGFFYTKNQANGLGARIQIISDKLPTFEKKILSVEHNGEKKTYTDGMKIELDDTITYQLEVTTYKPHSTTYTSSDNSLFGTVSYSAATWTDDLTGVTNESINLTSSNASAGTIAQVPAAVANETKATATTSFKLTMDNFDKVVDGTLTNTATLNYTYDAQYSKGSATASADAKAACEITTPTYIVDFGLPVELDLSGVLGGATISETTATDFSGDGSTLTYTASKPLSAKEYVGLTLKKSTGDQTIDQSYGVTIIPASNVLYEEDFLTPEATTSDSQPAWTRDETNAPETKQAAEKVGSEGIHGYDVAYASSTTANGVYEATGLNTQTMTAALSTTFTGTGFDLIGNCGYDTGRVMLVLQDQNTNKRYVSIVDTRYGTKNDDMLYQVPLAHREVPQGTYTVSIYASAAAAVEATSTANAVSTYSVNRTSASSSDAFERYLTENNITDVEYIVMNDVLTASVQSASAVSTYAATAATVTRPAGGHVEIDAFRVYYDTTEQANNPNTASYNDDEQNVQYVNILDVVEGEITAWTENGGKYEGVVTGYEAAGGPQNEIYLAQGQSVVFGVNSADAVQVSLRAVSGAPKWNNTAITSNTEMYYKVNPMEQKDGSYTVTIANSSDNLLAIGNVKLKANTQVTLASELEPEVVSYSLRMALTVEPDQPVEDEPEQPVVTFVPESLNPSIRSVNVLGRKLVTVSVTASTDVAYITVDGQKVNAWNNGLSWIYQPSTLRFTFTDLLKRGESKTYEIVAYNADGVASAVYTVQG